MTKKTPASNASGAKFGYTMWLGRDALPGYQMLSHGCGFMSIAAHFGE